MSDADINRTSPVRLSIPVVVLGKGRHLGRLVLAAPPAVEKNADQSPHGEEKEDGEQKVAFAHGGTGLRGGRGLQPRAGRLSDSTGAGHGRFHAWRRPRHYR